MNERELRLQPRLQCIADLVPRGARLADVGTDHGYLPVYLLQRRLISRAIASDINAAPLEHARRTAEERWQEKNAAARHMLNEGMARDDMVRADALEESHVRATRTLAEARQITEREKELTREVVSDRGEELARALADHLLSDEEAG